MQLQNSWLLVVHVATIGWFLHPLRIDALPVVVDDADVTHQPHGLHDQLLGQRGETILGTQL